MIAGRGGRQEGQDEEEEEEGIAGCIYSISSRGVVRGGGRVAVAVLSLLEDEAFFSRKESSGKAIRATAKGYISISFISQCHILYIIVLHRSPS
jgi:hypothetical protein